MRKYLLLLLFPAVLHAQDVAQPSPYPNTFYKKERIKQTTVYAVTVTPPYSLDIVIASPKGKGKKQLSQMINEAEKSESKNIILGVNASYFDPSTGEVIGTTVYRKKTIKEESLHRAQADIRDHMLSFGYDLPAVYSLLTAGPYLVKDGKNIALKAAREENFSKNYDSYHPRTALGKRADGSLVFVVVDGRKNNEKGMTLDELAQYLLQQKCVEAINMDGGGSSTLVLSGEFYGKDKRENYVQNKPSDGHERAVVNGIVVIENNK